MNTGFSAVLSCFYRKYRWWHLCLKQLAAAPFFHLKLTPCKVGETPQVLSWGPLSPSPVQEPPVGFLAEGWGSASCALTRPGTALHPGEALNVHVPLPPAHLFPSSQVHRAPPSLETRPCFARDGGYLFKWLPCHLAPGPEVPFSVDRCEQPVCRAGTLVLPPPPVP